MTDYAAVLSLHPDYAGREWSLNGDSYDGLTILDGGPVPSQSELDGKWPTVQYQREYATVEETRRSAYERDADPLFFRWQRGTGTEQEWLDAVQGVKDANPYPPAP